MRTLYNTRTYYYARINLTTAPSPLLNATVDGENGGFVSRQPPASRPAGAGLRFYIILRVFMYARSSYTFCETPMKYDGNFNLNDTSPPCVSAYRRGGGFWGEGAARIRRF